MTRIQGCGFLLTFVGLYLYDRTSDSAKADKRAREQVSDHPLLPLNTGDAAANKKSDGPMMFTQSPAHYEGGSVGSVGSGGGSSFAGRSGYALSADSAGSGPGRPSLSPNGRSPSPNVNGNGVPISLPPGTKAEATWSKAGDVGWQQKRGSQGVR